MWAQRMIRLLGRILFYMLLFPSLICLIYTLANQQLTAAMIFLVISVLVLYFGLIRIRIPANSVAVRDGKVVYCIPEKCVRNRFDFYSRGQTIVELPHFNLLDRPYKLEIVSPEAGGGVTVCRLTVTLGYIQDLDGYQQAYDQYLRYHERLSLVVKRELVSSASCLAWPSGMPAETEEEAYLKPIVTGLDRSLENLGLKIVEVNCTFDTGPTAVRLVAVEQEMIEREIVPANT